MGMLQLEVEERFGWVAYSYLLRCSTQNTRWITAPDPYRPEERTLTSAVFLGQIHEARMHEGCFWLGNNLK